jgi:hypothetical protein
LLSASAPALAFDTGHHADLVASVMRERGFSEAAIRGTQVANWCTDYFSVSPTSRDALETELPKLHFDNLYDTDDVAEYWGRLVDNARAATARAAESEDPLAVLTIMGLFLHAVQDFYSHANWVETHPREPGAPYRRETWLADGPGTTNAVRTGSYPPYPSPPPPGHPEHGGYDTGLNKDSHVRPLWAEAYVFAYLASHEVLDLMEAWAEHSRPGWWERVRGLELGAKDLKRLDRDVEASRDLSMSVKGKGSDGHWKGDGSGNPKKMSEVALEWTTKPASVFVRQVKKHRVHEQLTRGLYSGQKPPPLPDVRPFRESRRVIVVALTHVEEKRDGGRRIDPHGKADLYSVVTVAGQRYVDRVLRGTRRQVDPWITLHFADPRETDIPIRIEVWDQDAMIRANPDLCDAHPELGKQVLDLRFRPGDGHLAGDLEGRYDGPEAAFETAGEKPDANRIVLRGYVTSRLIRDR